MPTGRCAGSTTNTSQKSVVSVFVGAQEVDDLADRPMLGHRDEVALHQAAGGFLGIGERFLDRGAVVGVERAQHGALLVLLDVLDDRDRVVGLELAGDLGDLVRLERVEQLLADLVVHLGEHVAVEDVGERRGERAPVVAVDQLEQVGDVGGMERLDQSARALGVAGLGLRRSPRGRNRAAAGRPRRGGSRPEGWRAPLLRFRRRGCRSRSSRFSWPAKAGPRAS